MITVSDIVALPAFRFVELVAPCEGAGTREVCNVGILDCPPDYNEYSVYMPGEFVLTNLGFAFGNPDLAEKSLIAMIKRDVAGIAVKTVYNAPISELVCQTSAEYSVPVYVYDGGFHETVAYQSLDLINRDKEELDKGRMIDTLLHSHNGDETRKKLYDIANVTGSSIQCFAVLPQADDKCSLYATLDQVSLILASVQSECGGVESVHTCRYHDRILGFVSYCSTDPAAQRAAEERCSSQLVSVKLYCGIGETVPLTDGDIGIDQALMAANTAWNRREHIVRWSGLHADAFVDAARSSRLFMGASNLYRALLTTYDEEHGAELDATARVLVHLYGDVKAVSEEMFQHPNTIRYRMRKMKTLLGIPDETDKELIYLLSMMYLPVSGEDE